MDGTYNVKLRFTKDRAVKRISTDIFATEADLTPKLKFKEDTNTKQEIDKLVLHYRTSLITLHIDTENLDLNEIVMRLQNKDEAEKPIDFEYLCTHENDHPFRRCKLVGTIGGYHRCV